MNWTWNLLLLCLYPSKLKIQLTFQQIECSLYCSQCLWWPHGPYNIVFFGKGVKKTPKYQVTCLIQAHHEYEAILVCYFPHRVKECGLSPFTRYWIELPCFDLSFARVVVIRPSQLGELSRSEFDPELFSHSMYVKFFVTFATKVPYLTFCDKMRQFLM